MPKQVDETTKFYVAMMQCYKYATDADGNQIFDYVTEPWGTRKAYRQVKDEGKFRAFGTNGKVVSAYDSAATAARYCGKEGFVIEIDPLDGRKIGETLEKQLVHCESRMLFWAQEADRINKELQCQANPVTSNEP